MKRFRSIHELFRPAPKPVRKPVTHAYRGVVITRNHSGPFAIYCCTVAGISISNSKLGDLKRQIRALLDDYDDGGMAEERARHP